MSNLDLTEAIEAARDNWDSAYKYLAVEAVVAVVEPQMRKRITDELLSDAVVTAAAMALLDTGHTIDEQVRTVLGAAAAHIARAGAT